jgi:hypothetical protein
VRLTRSLALFSALAALAGAASGCSGGSDSSSASGTKPETWAADVCGALQTWEDELQSGSKQLSSDISRSKDLKSLKRRLVAFLKSAEQSTEKMVDDVKSAGAPAVEDGPAIQRDLEAGLADARGTFQHAVTQAKKLPTTNPKALTTGLSSLAQRTQGELTATGNQFSNLDKKYDVGDLNEAMADEPSCKPFVSSSG